MWRVDDQHVSLTDRFAIDEAVHLHAPPNLCSNITQRYKRSKIFRKRGQVYLRERSGGQMAQNAYKK
jgi:hypothetical protein